MMNDELNMKISEARKLMRHKKPLLPPLPGEIVYPPDLRYLFDEAPPEYRTQATLVLYPTLSFEAGGICRKGAYT